MSTSRGLLVHAFVVGVGAGLLGSCDSSPPPAPQAGLDDATVSRLLERIDRLVAAVEATQPAAGAIVSTGVESAKRVAATDEATELRARIEQLERELEVLRARGGGPSPALWFMAEPPPIRMDQVARVCAQINAEDEAEQQATRRTLFQWTQRQMLERFGMPTQIRESKGGNAQWLYQTEDSGFSVIFIDGVATVIDG